MKPKELLYRSWTRREVRREAAGCSREGKYKGLALSWQRELTRTDTTIQPKTTGDSPDDDQNIQMKPYVLSPTHDPFPMAMAMVNREPWGHKHPSIHPASTRPGTNSCRSKRADRTSS